MKSPLTVSASISIGIEYVVISTLPLTPFVSIIVKFPFAETSPLTVEISSCRAVTSFILIFEETLSISISWAT